MPSIQKQISLIFNKKKQQIFVDYFTYYIDLDNNLYEITVENHDPIIHNKIIQEVVCIKGNTPIEADNRSGDINSVIIYSKNILKLNTIDDDGRHSTLSDMPEAERKDYYIQFKVLIF